MINYWGKWTEGDKKQKLKESKNISLFVNRHDVAMVLHINMNLKLVFGLSTELINKGKLESGSLWQRVNALNVSTWISLRWPIYL